MLSLKYKGRERPTYRFIRKNYIVKWLQKFLFTWDYRRLIPFPARQRGMYILGKTGSGKSELMALSIYNDLYSPSGVLLIEPHGDLCRQINRFAQTHTETVYLSADYSSQETFFTYNPLENDYHKSKNLAHKLSRISLRTEELKGAFATIMGTEFTHPMERIVSNVLPVLLNKPGATFGDFLDFMKPETSEKLERLGQQFPSPEIAKFFEHEFQNPYFEATKQAILTRFGNVIATNYNVRKILMAEKSSFALKKLLDAGKCVLMNLSAGALGEQGSKIIGCFLISEVTTHALQRQKLKKKQRRSIFVYVDECQNFLSERMDKIMSEGRKYGVHLVMANQYLGQFAGESRLKSSIMANTSIKICGTASHADYKVMNQEIGLDIGSIPKLKEGKFALRVSSNPAKVVQLWDFLIEKEGKQNPSYLSEKEYATKLQQQVETYYKHLPEKEVKKPKAGTENQLEPKVQKLL